MMDKAQPISMKSPLKSKLLYVEVILMILILIFIKGPYSDYADKRVPLIQVEIEKTFTELGLTDLTYYVDFPYSLLELTTFKIVIDDYDLKSISPEKKAQLIKALEGLKIPDTKLKLRIMF